MTTTEPTHIFQYCPELLGQDFREDPEAVQDAIDALDGVFPGVRFVRLGEADDTVIHCYRTADRKWDDPMETRIFAAIADLLTSSREAA